MITAVFLRCALIMAGYAIITLNTIAQDTLFFRNNDRLVVTVLEVNDSVVSYKRQSNPDGPLYRKDLSELNRIRYKNGDTETFDHLHLGMVPVVIDPGSDPKSLITRGSRVFVEIPDDASRAGERYFVESLREWGYWTIVPDTSQANFIIVFNIDKKAMLDKSAFVILKTRGGQEIMRSKNFRSSTSAFNGYNAFRAIANKVVEKYFRPTFQ